jgi:uncharacterized protein
MVCARRASADSIVQMRGTRVRRDLIDSNHVVRVRDRCSVATSLPVVAPLPAARRQTRVFVVATSLISLQLAFAGLVDLSAGTFLPGLARLALAALAPLSWRTFDRGRRTTAVVISGGIGLAASCAGLAVYGLHAALAGPALIDLTGLAVIGAGLALVALAFRVALLGRSKLLQAALGIPAAFVVAQWGFLPAVGAGLATNAGHPHVPPAATLGLPGARDVDFRADDGTELAGWFVPGRTRAAVVLLHGSHGTRADTERHLRMLVRAGFAVLAFDARGHGQSEGTTNALGWRGDSDVTGAVAFLRRQPQVDASRIAALGLSMGAEEALRAASSDVPLAAVVADGAGASTLGDLRSASHGPSAPIAISTSWLSMREVEVLSGDDEPRPLVDVVGDIHVPVLLISSNAPHELAIDQTFRERSGARARLWHVADAGHTRALATHPGQYTSRTTRFLREELAPSGPALRKNRT